MKETIIYVVQFWISRYEYWSDAVEWPDGGSFGIPVVHYATEEEARVRLNALREASPSAQYRMVRRVTTEQVLAS